MFADAARERFTSMVTLADQDIDLLAASFLIAQEEYPNLSVAREIQRLDAIARRLERQIGGDADFFHAVHAINHVLFEEMGFRGNQEDYDDPDNSMLNRVLDRRRGLPITLSIVFIEVARRLGLDVQGVSFPGHFVVRMDDRWGATYIDPFYQGQVLLPSELKERFVRVLGGDARWRESYLQPARNKQVLTRLLYNLRRVYLSRGDLQRALMAAERIVILNPGRPRELRDRGLLYGRTGHREAAIADLRDYLTARPGAPDAARVRGVLSSLLARKAADQS